MTDLLAGRGVVVTGSGRGLGRAFALAAAREGAGVVVNDVDVAHAEDVVREIEAEGGTAVASAASVSDWAAAEDVIDTCVRSFGAIDGLVNNAVAYTYYGHPWEEQEDQVRKMVDVAVVGTIACGVHAMRRMRPRGAGSIVNITSRAHMGAPGMASYVAVKGAVASVTYGWALELMADRVRVNALAPGAHTRAHDMAVAAGIYSDQVHGAISSSPDGVAPAVVYLLSDLSAGITGQLFAMLGQRFGLFTHPRRLEHVAEREMWTADEIADVVERQFRDHLQPVGFAAEAYQWADRAARTGVTP